MKEILNEKACKKLIDYFKTDNNILGVWLIGSYGTEYQNEDSDIDFAFLFNREMNLQDEIKLECAITEILKFENIDVVNLMKAPITLRFKTIKDGKLMYEATTDKVLDFEEETIKTYQDRKYYIDMINRDFIQGPDAN